MRTRRRSNPPLYKRTLRKFTHPAIGCPHGGQGRERQRTGGKHLALAGSPALWRVATRRSTVNASSSKFHRRNSVCKRILTYSSRHQKTHLDRSERPHRCPTCSDSFLYPKDLHRHQRKHSDPSSASHTYRCDHPRCSNLDGFSRKDNLLRHQRKQHPAMVAAA
jgi:hypothetical protein